MRRTGPDLVADEHDIVRRERQPLERVADLDRRQRRVRAAGDGDAVLARGVDEDQRDTRRLPASVRSRATVDALSLEGRASLAAERVVPDRADEARRAPSRAAATAWLPPLPP